MKHYLNDTPCQKQRDVICADNYASYGEAIRTIRNKLRKAAPRDGAKVYTEFRLLYNIVHRFNG